MNSPGKGSKIFTCQFCCFLMATYCLDRLETKSCHRDLKEICVLLIIFGLNIFFYFLHEQKVTKILGFIKIGCVSLPEVSLTIQGMIDLHNSKPLSLLCIATHMPFTHTSVKNRYPIFLMPVPSKMNFTLRSNVKQGFGF